MKIITHLFSDIYTPVKAIMFYQSGTGDNLNFYAESLDMDDTGKPINPHPLSLAEANTLAETLNTSNQLRQDFLRSKGLMPDNILHINNTRNGYAVWFTPSMQVNLLFKEALTIPDGMAEVPPLIWKASKDHLHIYAFAKDKKPDLKTMLCNAPFFNIYADGKVCMGNVNISIASNCTLEDFMLQWQTYFFSSTFSHLLNNTSPVKGNIIELWQKLIGKNKPFPLKQLIATTKTLKSLLK